MTESNEKQNQYLLETIEQALVLLSKTGQSFSKDDLLLQIDRTRKLLAKALESPE